MAVVYTDTITRTASSSTSTSKSFTIPGGSSNTILLVFGHGTGESGAWSISSMTYNGDAMAQKWEVQHDTFFTNFCYYLKIPDDGSSFSLSINHTNGRMQASVLVLDNIDQTTTFDTQANNNSTSLDIASTAGDYVIDCISSLGSDAFGAVGASQTELLNANIIAYGSSAQSYELAAGASTTMSWGTDPSGTEYHYGVAVKSIAATTTAQAIWFS